MVCGSINEAHLAAQEMAALMSRQGVPQGVESQCLVAQTANQNDKDPEQSLLRRGLLLYEAMVHEDEPLCCAFSSVSQRRSSGFRGVVGFTGRQCRTSFACKGELLNS